MSDRDLGYHLARIRIDNRDFVSVPIRNIDHSARRMGGDAQRAAAHRDAFDNLSLDRIDDYKLVALWRGDKGALAVTGKRDAGGLAPDLDLICHGEGGKTDD